MDKRLIDTIEKIKTLSSQNAEFDAAMRELFGKTDSASSVFSESPDGRIDEIYEYCIERVIKEQSEQFYKFFPIQELVPKLVEDFCRMERYKREDNFEDYCLAVFQQMEIPDINNEETDDEKKDDKIVTNNQGDTTSIGKIIIQSDYDVRKNMPLIKMYFNERIRAVLYFVYFNGKYYKSVFEPTYNELNEIYQCRNLNHRGGESTPYQESIIEKILPHRYLYYLKFNGLLVNFVEHISAFMAKKEENGEITSVLPSGAVFIKQKDGNVFCIDKGKIWYKVKSLNKGDTVLIERNGMTNEIIDIKKRNKSDASSLYQSNNEV